MGYWYIVTYSECAEMGRFVAPSSILVLGGPCTEGVPPRAGISLTIEDMASHSVEFVLRSLLHVGGGVRLFPFEVLDNKTNKDIQEQGLH